MIVTGCEQCDKVWEECCGYGLSLEEIERINDEVDKILRKKTSPTSRIGICETLKKSDTSGFESQVGHYGFHILRK